MGAVVQAISRAVNSVVKFVGSAVSSVGKFVGNVVQNALDNPLETLATIAVIALAPYAAPLIGATVATTTAIGMGLVSATSVMAKGGSIGDALKAAALSAGTSWVGASVGAYVGNAATQAGASQFVGSTVGNMAGRAIAGAGNAALTGKDILEGAGSGALQGLVGSLTGSAIKEIGLTNTLTGSLGVGAGTYAANAISKSLAGGLNSLTRGQDFTVGAERGLSSSVFNDVVGDLYGSAKDYVKDVWNKNIAPWLDDVSEMRSNLQDQGKEIDSGIEQLNERSKEYDTEYGNAQRISQEAQELSPAYQKAVEAVTPYKQAYDAANATYEERNAAAQAALDAFRSKNTEYEGLYKQYEDAVAANNADETTRLEGILLPMNDELARLDAEFATAKTSLDESATALNTATEAVNGVYNEHATVLERGMELNKAFETSQATLQDIQTKATDLQTQLQTQRDAYDQGTADYNAKNEELSRQVQSYEQFVTAFQEGDDETASAYLQRTNPFDTSLAAQQGAQAEADNPWAASAGLGIQKFDDGSSIQFFDDGSSIVTDSEGKQYTYNEKGQAYNADAGLIGAPEQIGPNRFIIRFDDNSSMEVDGEGNPIVTYDTEGEVYEPGSNPLLPDNQQTKQPKSANKTNFNIPLNTAAGKQNAAVRRSTQTRQQATDAAREQATVQAQQQGLGDTTGGATKDTATAQANATPAYGLSDLFENVGTAAPLISLKGVGNIAGQQYTSLDPLDRSVQEHNKDKQSAEKSPYEQNNLDPLSGLYAKEDFGGSGAQAQDDTAPATQFSGLANLDPLSSLYGQHAAGGGVISKGPRLGGSAVYGQTHTAVKGGGDGVSDSVRAMVKPKSYVIPARAVSEIGNGSSSAGTQKLVKFTHHIGSLGALKHLASGGAVDEPPIEAMLSQDEFVIPPEVVAHIGGGDEDAGAKRLDAMVKQIDRRRKGLNTIADNGGDYLAGLT